MDERGAVAINRVVDILELLRDHPKGLALSIIAKSLELPKSTVFRLLNALLSRGMISQDKNTETYKLGFSILRMATSFLDGFDITSEARVRLEMLNKEWDETVHLGVLDESGNSMIYILKIDSTKAVRMHSQIGRPVPIHCTALGKAYFSCFKDVEIHNRLINYEFNRFSPSTILNRDDFMKEITLTRNRGFATDLGENDYYVYCIAAPLANIKNEPLGAVSMSMPSDRFDMKLLPEYGKSIRQAAQEISNHLRYIPI